MSRSPWQMRVGVRELGEVRRAQLLGLAHRVERVAEADETADGAGGVLLVGDHARHAPAERLAADHRDRIRLGAQLRDHGAVLVEHRLRPGFGRRMPSRRDAMYANSKRATRTAFGEQFGEVVHPSGVHGGACAVGEHQQTG